ncbi:MAG: hypothetical protein AAF799_44155 [Myxococcota bacterium]
MRAEESEPPSRACCESPPTDGYDFVPWDRMAHEVTQSEQIPQWLEVPAGLGQPRYPCVRMREWLMSLTRPEDHLLWAWAVIVGGYGVIGAMLGVRARRREAAASASASASETNSSSR